MINVTIDGVKVSVPAGSTVLDAARAAGILIPTLCYMRDVNAIGACRICVVDTGARALQAACVLPATDGMTVKTNTPAVRNARKSNLELILSTHDKRCLSCVRSTNCELQTLCREYGVEDEHRFYGSMNVYKPDTQSSAIMRNNNKCIVCRRCVSVCDKVQRVGVIGAVGRGFKTAIESAWGESLNDVACINCGQCIAACPVGALSERDDTQKVFDAIADPSKHVVVQPAPAVRATLGEEFGMPMGTAVTGKMVEALKRMGFDRVFDTNFGADMTIVEEASELISRIKNNGVLPMITSCSPGWVKFCEHFYPDFIPNLSSCKSPHQMVGATVKTYYAEKNGIDPADIVVVSVMPCTAKKFERQRPEMNHNGLDDVDVVVTTRELARMIKQSGIDFVNLPDGDFDDLMGESTGAGTIFGATGGVMEAALRSAYEWITGTELKKVEFDSVRGLDHIKEATIDMAGTQVNVAVVSSTGAAARVLDMVRSGEKNYAFIEVMACPGGCVNGGGQPIVTTAEREIHDPRVLRAQALYNEDKGKPRRKSHENEQLIRMYKEYFGEFNGHKAHEILHTHYYERPKYK